MTRSALVIHSDEKQLRFACDALVMFHPGYRVNTASDLATASDWLEILTPDLVILEASIADPDVLDGWAERHSIDTDRTILFGNAFDDERPVSVGSVTIAEPVKLPDFMATVRTIANRTNTYNPMTMNQIQEDADR